MFLVTDKPMHLLPRLVRKEDGATAVEYGIMVALIAVVIIAAVTLLGGGLFGSFDETACAVRGGTYAAPAAAAPAGTAGVCTP